MNTLLSRILLPCLLAAPLVAAGQETRYEYGGQAHVFSELQTMIARAVAAEAGIDAPNRLGQVVFYRPATAGDREDAWLVHSSNVRLNDLAKGAYFVALVPPGTYHYGIDADGKPVDIVVQAGRAYYLRANAGADGTPALTVSSALSFYTDFGPRPRTVL